MNRLVDYYTLCARPGYYSKEDALASVGHGWYNLVESIYAYFAHLYAAYGLLVLVYDCKSKYGQLAVSYDVDHSKMIKNYDEDVLAQTVMAYEKKSLLSCEECGGSGFQTRLYG